MERHFNVFDAAIVRDGRAVVFRFSGVHGKSAVLRMSCMRTVRSNDLCTLVVDGGGSICLDSI